MSHNAATYWHRAPQRSTRYKPGFHVEDTGGDYAVAVLAAEPGVCDCHVALCQMKEDAERIADLLNAANFPDLGKPHKPNCSLYGLTVTTACGECGATRGEA